MPKMSSKDAAFHATQDLIYALHNTAPENSLFKLGNRNKGSLMTLSEIFRKSSPPSVSPRVPAREVVQEKLEEANQERSQMKISSKSKPVTDKEPPRVPIVEAYPEVLYQ